MQTRSILLMNNSQLVGGYLYSKKCLFFRVVNVNCQLVNVNESLSIMRWMRLRKKKCSYGCYTKN